MKRAWAAAIVVGALSACGPVLGDRVAMGTARLSIRSAAAVATLVTEDATCGFKSPAVLAAAQLDGPLGRAGEATLRVEHCRIELPPGTLVRSNCLGEETRASGVIVVSATRRIRGLLTGGAQTPAIPAASDAVSITLDVESAQDFLVTDSTGEETLTITEGGFSVTLTPRLVVSSSTGACAVATPHATFTDLSWRPSQLRVHTPQVDFVVGVESSRINAQNGKGPSGENALSGTLTASIRAALEPPQPPRTFELPTRGEQAVLDPDYDAARFTERYACTPDLATPESTTCADLSPRVADGAARLTIKALGSVVSAMNVDHDCGFFSDAVQQAAMITGTVGGSGTAVTTLNACERTYRSGTTISTDCGNVRTTFTGTITVSGTKSVTGTLTGNPQAPAIPADDHSVVFNLSVTMQDFHVGTSADETGITVSSGTLSGRVEVRTARAESSGACSIATPITRFSDVRWTNADVLVHSATGALAIHVEDALLNALNGSWGADTNVLGGTLRGDGVERAVPSDGAGLNPAYESDAFAATWSCTQDLALPVDFACIP